ncbi:MAG TPA: DUF4974 domain-containing protein, partial [Flavobacteriales bacterium]|nr:DUF4974 domain-containing protein [Flavobacteriales bacterium]
LERQYNVKIQFKNVDLSQKFTGTFINTDLDQALKAVTVPFNLTYHINSADKTITISSE